MSAAYYPQVQEIYVAYYGRPADPAGLQYWAGQLAANGGNLNAIINAFGTSAESTALYAGASNAAKVTAIYQQLFNRAPETTGLNFYTSALTAGTMTAASIALNVADGASGADLTTLNNKITVASAFTDALTVDGAAAVAYVGTTAANTARSLISGVTTSAATTNVASTVATIKSGGGAAAGQTFTLTDDTQSQDFSGNTSGIKVIVNGDDDATEGDEFDITLGSGDDTLQLESFLTAKLDGGAGADTLDLSEYDPGAVVDVSLATGATSAEVIVRNFENVVASPAGGRIVGDAGANTITSGEGGDDISGGGGNDKFLVNVDDLENDDFSGGGGTDSLTISGDDTIAMEAGDEELVSVENITFSSPGDDLTVTLDGYLDSANTITTADTDEITNITGDGADDTLNIVSAAAAVNLIGVSIAGFETITADKDLVINASTSFGNAKVVDAVTAADDLYLNGAGIFDLSKVSVKFDDIVGNASAQTILWSNKTNSAGETNKIDGGGGTDTIKAANTTTLDLSVDGNVAAGFDVDNIENIDFGSADRVIIDEADATDFLKITGTGGTSDALVIDGDDSAVSAVLTNAVLSGVESIILEDYDAGSALTIGLKSLSGVSKVSAGSGTTDALTLGASGVSIAGVVFDGIEVLDIGANDLTVDIASLSGFSYVEGNGGTITLSDSGAVTLNDDGTLGGVVNVTFFSGDDTVTASGFVDNNKASTWDFGKGNDVLIWGSTTDFKNTTINFGAGDDTLRVGADMAANGAETLAVDGGSGTDTLEIGAATYVNADVADLANFEVIKASSGSSTAYSITLGAESSLTVVDLSLDTTTVSETNVVDLDAFVGTSMKVIGSSGSDTITTIGDSGTGSASFTTVVDAGGGADTVNVKGSLGLGVVTVTLGSGVDTVDTSDLEAKGIDAGNSFRDSVTITDFVGGSGGDKIKNADIDTNWVAMEQVNAAVQASTTVVTLANALSAAVTAATAGQAVDAGSAFVYNGDTYVFYVADGSAGWNITTDYYVKLTGVVNLNGTHNIIS